MKKLRTCFVCAMMFAVCWRVKELNNDDCVLGVPNIQCPSCEFMLELNGKKFGKFSKAQRRKRHGAIRGEQVNAESTRGYSPRVDDEDGPSDFPERVFMCLSCPNELCEQYTKFKVMELPKVKVSTAKVDLS